KLYGGTERIVSYLTEELVALGHQVTLFASGDSKTAGMLHPGTPTALRLNPACGDSTAYMVLMLEQVMQKSHHFDVIHLHVDWLHFPLFRRHPVPSVTTVHGRLDLPELQPLFSEFCDTPVISISDAQRKPLPWANWVGTVHHGLPLNLLKPGREGDGYLAFLGRISPEKQPDAAIRLALRSGKRLKIAAKIDRVDQAYFESVIRPLLDAPGIDYLGEIAEDQKADFLGRAEALLFPVDWPEPFGLVMIEAFACGTPVIAFDRGSVREVVEPGLTGFICANEEEALSAIARVPTLDRTAIRRQFERRFTSRRMAEDYLRLYRSLARPPLTQLEAV
ncbi:MAG TPA: glycosyltransferase family 4 protein, partial [Stellaceae bacterium]|nr:glycosyltransferase family 4 protein [Stellaceae bacterium]